MYFVNLKIDSRCDVVGDYAKLFLYATANWGRHWLRNVKPFGERAIYIVPDALRNIQNNRDYAKLFLYATANWGITQNFS